MNKTDCPECMVSPEGCPLHPTDMPEDLSEPPAAAHDHGYSPEVVPVQTREFVCSSCKFVLPKVLDVGTGICQDCWSPRTAAA